ncbi:hypothetical protein [Brucella haematophila]|uniref:hypothetical protein n=1 Tax=Brucella haematophila TaxID=419474 RepID=UPI004042DDE2
MNSLAENLRRSFPDLPFFLQQSPINRGAAYQYFARITDADGVRVSPRAFSKALGPSSSQTETSELDVPRSIPTIAILQSSIQCQHQTALTSQL